MDSLKCQLWPHPSPYEASKVAPRRRADSPAALPPLSPLPISPLFFSHNKSGPDFPKQTALWGPSPPITLCQFQSGLKYDSTVCASPVPPSPPPNLHVIPTIASSLTTVTIGGRPNRSALAAGRVTSRRARSGLPFLTVQQWKTRQKLCPPFPSLPKLRQVIRAGREP